MPGGQTRPFRTREGHEGPLGLGARLKSKGELGGSWKVAPSLRLSCLKRPEREGHWHVARKLRNNPHTLTVSSSEWFPLQRHPRAYSLSVTHTVLAHPPDLLFFINHLDVVAGAHEPSCPTLGSAQISLAGHFALPKRHLGFPPHLRSLMNWEMCNQKDFPVVEPATVLVTLQLLKAGSVAVKKNPLLKAFAPKA